MKLLRDFLRRGLGYALDVDTDANGAGAFGRRLRHRLDVAIGGIIEDENFRHWRFAFSFADKVWSQR